MSSPVTRHLILRKTSPVPGKPIDSFLMICPNHITVKAISFILSGIKILSKTRFMFQAYSTQRSCQMAILVFLLLAIIFVFALSTSILTYTTYFVKSCQTAKPLFLGILCIPSFPLFQGNQPKPEIASSLTLLAMTAEGYTPRNDRKRMPF